MNGYIEKPNQEQRILKILQDANGNWIDGQKVFLHQEYISQYHARIWGLQKKGYNIEARFVEGKNWKEYSLIPKNTLF